MVLAFFHSEGAGMKWHKDDDGRWRYGDWRIEPYFLRRRRKRYDGSYELALYRNGYVVSKWWPLCGHWFIRHFVDTIKEAKALVKELVEEEANRKALDILDGMKGGGE
jgi:hypothetical protein